MNAIQSRVVGVGVLYLFIFLAGFWLSHSGTPYSGIILTIHKLISLAALVLLGRTVYQINQAAKLGAIELLTVAVTGLFFLGTIATGGLLSTGKTMPAVVLRLHQITPYLVALSTAATMYLLSKC